MGVLATVGGQPFASFGFIRGGREIRQPYSPNRQRQRQGGDNHNRNTVTWRLLSLHDADLSSRPPLVNRRAA